MPPVFQSANGFNILLEVERQGMNIMKFCVHSPSKFMKFVNEVDPYLEMFKYNISSLAQFEIKFMFSDPVLPSGVRAGSGRRLGET